MRRWAIPGYDRSVYYWMKHLHDSIRPIYRTNLLNFFKSVDSMEFSPHPFLTIHIMLCRGQTGAAQKFLISLFSIMGKDGGLETLTRLLKKAEEEAATHINITSVCDPFNMFFQKQVISHVYGPSSVKGVVF